MILLRKLNNPEPHLGRLSCGNALTLLSSPALCLVLSHTLLPSTLLAAHLILPRSACARGRRQRSPGTHALLAGGPAQPRHLASLSRRCSQASSGCCTCR